jgi:hypothetical protein
MVPDRVSGFDPRSSNPSTRDPVIILEDRDAHRPLHLPTARDSLRFQVFQFVLV